MLENQIQLNSEEEYKVTTFGQYIPLAERNARRQERLRTFKETDPNGKNQHEKGSKVDAGKPRMDLVLGGFASALIEVTKVGTFGANKYTDDGWKEVPKGKERYTDAMLRHWVYERSGEDYDDDSGLLHASHLAWNALARLAFILEENKSVNN